MAPFEVTIEARFYVSIESDDEDSAWERAEVELIPVVEDRLSNPELPGALGSTTIANITVEEVEAG
jgi:hypothetical protein